MTTSHRPVPYRKVSSVCASNISSTPQPSTVHASHILRQAATSSFCPRTIQTQPATQDERIGPRILIRLVSKMTNFWNRSLIRLIGHEALNNEMYGHAGVLRRYCGLKIPIPIQGFVQHGWSFGPGIPFDDLESGGLSRDSHFSLWNPRNEEQCHELGFHNVRVIGAPLLYLQPLPKPSNEAPKSLLLFPGHSANSEPFAEDGAGFFSKYLEELHPVISSFQSTTICLYWREFEDTRIRRQVEDRGLAITTLGNRDQTPNFVARLRDLVLRHQYVSSNSYSTALFYSLYLGRRTFVHGQTFVGRLKPESVDSLTQYDEMRRRYPQLEWDRFNDTSYQDIGADEIGASFQLRPDELRAELGWTPSRQLTSIGRRAGGYAWRKLNLSGG